MKVGVLMSEKKRAVLSARGTFASTRNLEFSMIDESGDLKIQCEGLDLLLTKVSDFSNAKITNFLETTEIKQFVSLENQKLVTDRLDTFLRLHGVVRMAHTETYRDDYQLFPVMVKSRLACGPASSHRMGIANDSASLSRIVAELPGELVLQEYIPHDGCLFKVFGIGTDFFVFLRPSLPVGAIPRDSFDSQVYFKSLPKLHVDPSAEDVALLSEMGRRIGLETQLKLFGFDAVKDGNGSLVVVDVNYFPSYGEVADFPRLLESLILTR